MDSVGSEYLFYFRAAIVGALVGAFGLVVYYVLRLFSGEENAEKRNQIDNKSARSTAEKVKRDHQSEKSSKSNKKSQEKKWSNKGEKQTFADPWLVKSLKGHTGEVLDVDFSSNNKYIVSCGDDDPGGDIETSSTSSESSKENSRPETPESSPRSKRLSRRQRKNRKREDISKSKKVENKSKKKMEIIPLTAWIQMGITGRQLEDILQKFLVSFPTMVDMGYPILMTPVTQRKNFFTQRKNFVIIYKNLPGQQMHVCPIALLNQMLQMQPPPGITLKNCFGPTYDYDSGHGSGNSSDSGESVDWDGGAPPRTPPPDPNSRTPEKKQHQCIRCGDTFFTMGDSMVMSERKCIYHWGKLHTNYKPCGAILSEYTCCSGGPEAPGCEQNNLHVWDGVTTGLNMFTDFVITKHRRTPPADGSFGIYALDCEMCYTAKGLELAAVTIIAVDGHVVYSSYVRPRGMIIDYNTRFSGITARHLVHAKSLKEVQNDIMGFINADTILIGHGLENDLRALKIVHTKVVDTAHCFPHQRGLPYRRSLKSLAKMILKRDIQQNRHSAHEDALACLEIVIHMVYSNMYP